MHTHTHIHTNDHQNERQTKQKTRRGWRSFPISMWMWDRKRPGPVYLLCVFIFVPSPSLPFMLPSPSPHKAWHASAKGTKTSNTTGFLFVPVDLVKQRGESVREKDTLGDEYTPCHSHSHTHTHTHFGCGLLQRGSFFHP